MIQFQENAWIGGMTDRPYFIGPLQATAGGPIRKYHQQKT